MERRDRERGFWWGFTTYHHTTGHVVPKVYLKVQIRLIIRVVSNTRCYECELSLVVAFNDMLASPCPVALVGDGYQSHPREPHGVAKQIRTEQHKIKLTIQ